MGNTDTVPTTPATPPTAIFCQRGMWTVAVETAAAALTGAGVGVLMATVRRLLIAAGDGEANTTSSDGAGLRSSLLGRRCALMKVQITLSGEGGDLQWRKWPRPRCATQLEKSDGAGGLLIMVGEAKQATTHVQPSKTSRSKPRHLSAADLTHFHSHRDHFWTIRGTYSLWGVTPAQAKGDIIIHSIEST